MRKEIIHLADGKTILAEVAGKGLDGQHGSVLLAIEAGNLYHTLRDSREIEVEMRADGEWHEVSNHMAVKLPGEIHLAKSTAFSIDRGETRRILTDIQAEEKK